MRPSSTHSEENIVTAINAYELVVEPVCHPRFRSFHTASKNRAYLVEPENEGRPDPGGDAHRIVGDDTALTVKPRDRHLAHHKPLRWRSQRVNTSTATRLMRNST